MGFLVLSSLLTSLLLPIRTYEVDVPVLVCYYYQPLLSVVPTESVATQTELELSQSVQAKYTSCHIKAEVSQSGKADEKVVMVFELPEDEEIAELKLMLPAQIKTKVYKLELEFPKNKINYVSTCYPTFFAKKIYERATKGETCGTMEIKDNILVANFKLGGTAKERGNSVVITISMESDVIYMPNSGFNYNFALRSFFKYGSAIDEEKSNFKQQNSSVCDLKAEFNFDNLEFISSSKGGEIRKNGNNFSVLFKDPKDDILSIRYKPSKYDNKVRAQRFDIDGKNVLKLTVPPDFDAIKESGNKPCEVIFLLDASGSMNSPRKNPACSLLKKTVKCLINYYAGKDEVFVNFFSFNNFVIKKAIRKPESFKIKWKNENTLPDDVTVDELISFYNSNGAYEPAGGTNIYEALSHAISTKRIKVGGVEIPRKICVITDGGDNNISNIENLIKSHSDVRFFALGLGQAASIHTISSIANAGLGFWEHVSEVQNLTDTLFKMILQFPIDPREFECFFCEKNVSISSFVKNGSLDSINSIIQVPSPDKTRRLAVNCFQEIYYISNSIQDDKIIYFNIGGFIYELPTYNEIQLAKKSQEDMIKRRFANEVSEEIIIDFLRKLEKDHSGIFESGLKNIKKILMEDVFFDFFKEFIDWCVTKDIFNYYTAFVIGDNLPDKHLWKYDTDMKQYLVDQMVELCEKSKPCDHDVYDAATSAKLKNEDIPPNKDFVDHKKTNYRDGFLFFHALKLINSGATFEYVIKFFKRVSDVLKVDLEKTKEKVERENFSSDKQKVIRLVQYFFYGFSDLKDFQRIMLEDLTRFLIKEE